TAGGQLSATSTDTLQLQVRNRLDNTGGTLGSNGAVDLTAASFINNQGALQAAGAGKNRLDVAGALENRSGSILTAGNATVEAGAFDNRGGTLHAAGTSQLVLDVDGLLDNRTEGVVSSGGDAVVTAQSLDNRDGTLATGGALTVTTVGTINNESGLVQAGKALTLSSQGLTNTAGTVLGASVDVDTRGLALDNRSGMLASLSGSLGIHSGALDNSGGLLQSAAGLSINTAGHALTNRNSGSAGGIVSAGTLEISSGNLDNRAGVVFAQGNAQLGVGAMDNTQGGSLVSASDVTLRAVSLANSGGEVKSGRNADISLQGALDNNAGLVASTGNLVLQAATVDNRNTAAGSTLGLQAGSLQVNAQRLDNQQGQVIADDGARLELTGQLNNTAGQVSTGGDLGVRADDVVNTQGTLVSGGNLQLDARYLSGDGKVLSQGNATLNLVKGFTNTDEVAANGKLSLTTQGALDNQGKLQGGSLEIHANRINNASNGEISSAGLTHLVADGAIVNRGLLDGVVNHIQASELDNVGSGRIYGDHVAIQAGNLLNRAESVAGITTAATIAARERLDLGVGTLSNTGQSLIFSDGNAAIGGALDANRIAVGAAAKIDNISSTIEVSGDLDIASLVVNNIRENVVVTQSTTVKAPVRMDQPGWFNNGTNSNSDIRNSSNYRAYEIYYLSADDILEDESYVTPDGYMIRKAVIRVTPQTSAYFFGRGSLYGAKGERSRLVMGDDTMTIYYSGRQDNQVNPDQVAGGADDPFLELRHTEPGSPAFSYVSDTLAYSNAYGTCMTNCVQLTALYQYNDPEHILTEMRRHPQNLSGNEQYRIATQTVVEDVLVSAGADAVIHAGGNMRIRTDTLLNQYASISADRNLTVVGINQSTSSVSNVGYTLYRTHSFKNVSYAYNGSSSAWSNPDISERAGQIGGLITAGGTLTVDVGDLSNLNNGRDAPNVQDGALVANLNTQGPAGGNVGPGAGQVQGPGQANGQGASGASVQGPGAAGGAGAGSDVAGEKLQNLTSRGADVASVAGPGTAQNNGQGNSIVVDGTSALGSTTAVQAAGDNPGVVVTTTVNNKAPNASLFKVDANGGQYLVETDPRFANYRNWLSSDHLLAQMGFDPASTQKRLGDGFYEQKLVREQIGELTGRRFLDGYASDEDQYRALLESGATVAKGWGLRPGIALSAEQMAQLTSDIVWLVEQTITLADGSTTTALVPQVYLRVQPGDLDRNGALLAGANVDIKLQGDLVNQGDIAGRQLVSIDAGNIRNLSGANISGQQVGLQARQDIDTIGSTVTAADAMSVKAGGNITVASTTQSWDTGGSYQQRTTSIDRVAGLYVTNPSGQGVLAVNAGGDVNLTAAQVVNAGVDGTTVLAAGGNLNLATITETRNVDVITDSRNRYSTSQTTQVGSTVSGAGNVVLQAGNDVNLAAANVSAGKAIAVQAGRDINSTAATDTATLDHSQAGKRWSKTVSASEETVHGTQLNAGGNIAMQAGRDITLQAATVGSETGGIGLSAGRDVNLTAAQEQHDLTIDEQRTKKGFLKSKTTTTHDEWHDSIAVTTSLSGETVTIAAGRDITSQGAQIVGAGDVLLAAGRDLTLGAAQSTSTEVHDKTVKKSGLFGSGGIGFTIGKQQTDTEADITGVTHTGSTVGSLTGDVTLVAGNALKIEGSDVIALQGDITAKAKSISITEVQDTSTVEQQTRFKQAGLTVAVSAPALSLLQTADDLNKAAKQSGGDGRMQALAAGTAALNAYNSAGAMGQLADGLASGNPANMAKGANVSISATIGGSKSESKTIQSSSQAKGSSLQAGGDVTLIATGGGEDSNILVRGSDITAGNNVLLAADNNVTLEAARNTAEQHSTSKSSSGAIGVAASYGSDGAAFGVTASASSSRGKADGEDVTHRNTHVSAGNTATVISGGDTTLKGAQLSAERVVANVGGDLSIESLQDTSTYDSKNKNMGGSVTVGAGFSGSASYSSSNVKGDYASVTEQSGIQAGAGGFDITVAGNTDLKGAVIASTQEAVDAGVNRLQTGTLSTSDIDNHSQYNAKSVSLSGGYSVAGEGSSGANEGSPSTTNNGTNWSWQNFNTGAQGAAAGYGSEKGKDSSITTSGISGGVVAITDQAGQQSLTGKTAEEALVGLNREVLTGDDANGLAKAWDGQKLQQQVEAQAQITAMFGQQASKAVGDYAAKKAVELRLQGKIEDAEKWDEGGAYRVAAHTFMGILSGGIDGAVGAGGAAAAAPYLEVVTENLPAGVKEIFGAGLAMGIGSVAGGRGAAAAFNEDTNNRQLTHVESARIKELADGDPLREAQLLAAACALVKCSSEYPAGSPDEKFWAAIEVMGNRSEAQADREWLLAQVQSEYQYTAGYGVLSITNLFEYTRSDAFSDWYGKNVMGTRGWGAVQMFAGAAQSAGGLAIAPTCPSVLGCAAALYMAGSGLDNSRAGYLTMTNGEQAHTLGGLAFQKLGLSAQAAEIVYGLTQLAPAAAGAVVMNRAVDIESAANAWARGTYNGASAVGYDGRVYRFSDPKWINSTFDVHPGNVAADHRYSAPGVGSVYSGTTFDTAVAEVNSYRDWGVATAPRVLVAGNVKIEGVLDLTNPAALRALGVTREQVVMSSHGANGSYDQTQRIASWAREQGYNAILAPSAQNKTGVNLITFDSTKVENVGLAHPISVP
ncbi:hemagglutinin repeat-containing protein, partial [Stenotrophomonas sp.]|uniref:hemagglutinin repeat-containing protein n=1 Tax=Stenotrophomonas sp. TaxID=69392 RepID=UPI0031BA0725